MKILSKNSKNLEQELKWYKGSLYFYIEFMPIFWVILVVSGGIIIAWPEIIAYMIGGLLLFLGMNILLAKYLFSKKWNSGENYVKFWNYKIYKD